MSEGVQSSCSAYRWTAVGRRPPVDQSIFIVRQPKARIKSYSSRFIFVTPAFLLSGKLVWGGSSHSHHSKGPPPCLSLLSNQCWALNSLAQLDVRHVGDPAPRKAEALQRPEQARSALVSSEALTLGRSYSVNSPNLYPFKVINPDNKNVFASEFSLNIGSPF